MVNEREGEIGEERDELLIADSETASGRVSMPWGHTHTILHVYEQQIIMNIKVDNI